MGSLADIAGASKGGEDPDPGQQGQRLAADVLWSDPASQPGVQLGARPGDVGILFGPDQTEVRAGASVAPGPQDGAQCQQSACPAQQMQGSELPPVWVSCGSEDERRASRHAEHRSPGLAWVPLPAA